MNSPDPARPVLVKQEEPEDQPDLNILHMVVCKEEDSPEQEQSPSLLQEEPESPHIKDEHEELLLRPGESDGSTLTLLATKEEDDDEDTLSYCSGIEVELESDSEVTEDSDEWEETSGGEMSQSSQTSSKTQVIACSACSLAFTSQVFYLNHTKKSHNDLYCQMLRNELIPSAASQQITNPVTRQKQGDQPRSSSHHRCKTITQPGVVKTQQLIVTEKKAHICKHCDKSFIRSADLNRHQSVHTGEKPFHCKYCDKRFSVSSHLNTHQRVHTGEKPFLCKYCDKRFSESGSLKTHLHVHTGEKPFHCKHCVKGFSQLSNLKKHERRIHTGEKPFQCELCNKSFSESGSLKTHQRVHTGEKPFLCKYCEKRFSESGTLKKHQRRIHTEVKHLS